MSLELISWREFERRRRRGNLIIVDLRDCESYREGHVPGAWSLPYEEWEARGTEALVGVSWNRPVYFYCERGNSALLVGREWAKKGGMAVTVIGKYPETAVK